jgi:hypothetical protein
MGRHTVNSTARRARQLRIKLKEINPSNSHEQLQSPLFSKIPPEIRNQIFELAASQHDDAVDPFEHYDKSTRFLNFDPATEQQRKRCLDLLLTCRRIYYETSSIPMRSATHHIIAESYTKSVTWFSSLTAKNIDELDHVILILDDLSWNALDILSLPQCRPNHVTISYIRDQSLCERLVAKSPDYAVEFFDHVVSKRLPESIISCVFEFEAWSVNQETMRNIAEKAEVMIEERATRGTCLKRTDGKSLVRNQTPLSIRHSWDERVPATDYFVAKFVFTLEK